MYGSNKIESENKQPGIDRMRTFDTFTLVIIELNVSSILSVHKLYV